MATKKTKSGLFERIKKYFKSVRSELKKVTWPTLKEVGTYALVVLVLTFVIAAFIGLSDVVLQKVFLSWI